MATIRFPEGKRYPIRFKGAESEGWQLVALNSVSAFVKHPASFTVRIPLENLTVIDLTPGASTGIDRLQITLFDHVYGPDSFYRTVREDAPELLMNYWLDACEIARAHPHLLSLSEREELGL